MRYRLAVILLFALLSCMHAQAQTDDKAAEYMRRLAAAMESMPAYTVRFTASAGDAESIVGRYEVDGSRYHISVAGMEVYGDDDVRREIDAAHREIVVDKADTTGHNLLTNPVHGFRFLGDDYRLRLDSEDDSRAVVTLTPIAKGASAEVITVTLSASESFPQQICYDYEGERVIIAIESIAKGASVPHFDAADYPGYEIIDFR